MLCMDTLDLFLLNLLTYLLSGCSFIVYDTYPKINKLIIMIIIIIIIIITIIICNVLLLVRN